MDELERYHQGEIGRFTASGDWSSLVRHFMRHGGYQPAMDAAIRILEGQAGRAALLGDQITSVAHRLKEWQYPATWEGLDILLPKLMDTEGRITLVLLFSFFQGSAAIHFSEQMGDERTGSILPPLLRAMDTGVAVARSQNEPAIAAALSGVAAASWSSLGRSDEALTRAQESVEGYRHLAWKNRPAFLPALALSLNNVAKSLSGLSRHEEALERAEEAVRYLRELAGTDRAKFLPRLALSVNNLVAMLNRLGRREEALERALEAVTAYRELVRLNRAQHLPDLAMSLNNVAAMLSAFGRREDALDQAEEAVRYLRELVGLSRAECLPDLAMYLNTQAALLIGLGRREEALDRAEEAVRYLRELAGSNRAEFLPSLARYLNNLAAMLSELGRREEALGRAEEAVRYLRELVGVNRAEFLPDLAASLTTLANNLSKSGRRDDALWRAVEAVMAYRELAGMNRAAFPREFGIALNTMANNLSESGLHEEALKWAEEAVMTHRELAATIRAAVLPDLARSLNDLATIFSKLGRREEALDRAEEAVGYLRELAAMNRAAFLPYLAMSLNNLATISRRLGRGEGALERVEEAVTAYRELAATNRAAFLPYLAMFLNNLATMLSTMGRREEALERAQEAVTAYRELAGMDRVAFLPGLAISLDVMANVFSGLGSREQALEPAMDAVSAYRELAEMNRAAFLPDLARSLTNMAATLSDLGRREEALKRAQESVNAFRELPNATQHAHAEDRSKAYRTVGTICLTPDESGARDLARALDALRGSIQCIEAHRGSFRDDDRRRRVLAEAIDSYELLVLTAVALWDIQRDVEPLRLALHAAEGIRQRQLLERLRAEVLEPDAPEAVRQEWRRRFDELEAAELALQTFALRSPGRMLAGMGTGHASPILDDPRSALEEEPAEVNQDLMRMELEQRRDGASRHHERALKAVHETHPGFDPYQPVPLANHADAQRLLEAIPGTVLVEYVVSQGGGYALLVWGAQLHAVWLPEVSVSRALDLAKRWMEGYPEPARSREDKVEVLTRWGEGMKAKLLEFAPKVLWPVLRALKEFERRHQFEAERLLLCPHQFLNLLPFHAMPLEGQADDLLVDRYEISYLPSLSVMKRCAGRRPGTGRQILFGNPMDDLPFIGLATEAYRRDHPEAEVIHGSSASVKQLIQRGSRMGRGEIWAHMKASNDPMTSVIRLGNGEELQLERIYRELRLRFKPHLTLNGCESGLMNPVRRRNSAGGATELAVDDLTDFDGLPMGFLFAGARSVVSTLWKVFDISAALLMDRYHLELRKDGATPVGALRRASQWLRKEIRNGADLLSAGESLLARVPEQWARAHPRDMEYCRRVLVHEAAEHPEDPPFANPIHWASHFVTGWSWDSVES